MRLVSIKRWMACRKDAVCVSDKRPSANTGGSERRDGARATSGNYTKELRGSVCVCLCVLERCQMEEKKSRRKADFRDLGGEEVLG